MPKINIYSKEECDAAFSSSAELALKADKATTYTKTETDAMMLQERTIRSQADENLQDQIDLLEAGSDVKDVVGTYAELQAYDTTTLNPNDIVKVLSDSTHDGAETYYRWIVTGGVGAWQFIGAKARTYTAQETDLLLAQKADKVDTYTKLETDNLLLQKQEVLTFDTTPMLGSTNPVTSRGIKNALDLKADSADVYTKAETYSRAEADGLLADKADASDVYTKLETDGLLATKQDELTFDNAPTAGSSNPVKSGGIKTALDAKQATLVSGTNIKTVNGDSILGSGDLSVEGAWEKLDRTRLPSDFVLGDILLINLTAGRTASVTPASWATVPTGTISVTSGGPHSAVVIRLASGGTAVDLPLSLTVGGLSVLTVTMPSVGSANDWNNASTSTPLFSLQASQFNGGGSIRSELLRVTKANITSYTASIYRLRKR